MGRTSFRILTFLAIALSVTLVITACGGDDATAAAAEEIYTVAKGNIRTSVSSSGSVSFPNQKTLTFGSPGTVSKVLVLEGARVTKDQILAEIDLADVQMAVTKAETTLLSAQQALDDAKKTNGALDLAKAQEAVATAKLQMKTAQDALDDARGTGYQTELRLKQEALANAQTLLQQAKDALDKAKVPYTDQDIAKQKEAVATAIQAVQLAQDAATTAKKPYTAEEIASAAAALDQAKQSLGNTLTSQTITEATQTRLVREASDLLETRRRAYRAAWTAAGFGIPEVDIFLSPVEIYQKHPATAPTLTDVTTLWNNLIIARDGLESAKATQTSSVTSAQRSLTSAQDAVRTSQTNYDKLAAGSDSLDLATKQAKITTAQETLKFAQENLTKMLAGADALDVALKQAKISSAEVTLRVAQENLAKIRSGPASEDIAVKEAKIITAKASLQDADEKLAIVKKGPDAITLNLRVTQVNEAQTSLQAAKDKLALAQIKAPYDGVVNAVNVKVGDTISAATAALLIVDISQAEVQAVVDEADVLNIREGLPVQVTLNQAAGVSIAGTVRFISILPNRQQGIVSYNIKIALTVPAIGQGAGGAGQTPGAGRPGGPGGTGGAGGNQGGGAQPGAGQGGAPGGQRPGAGAAQGALATAVASGSAGAFGGRGAALAQGGVNPLSLLRDGLSVQSTIVVSQATDVIVVPSRALSGNVANRIVKVIKADGAREERSVQTGLTDGTNTQIVSGLEEGEKVAVPARGSGQRTTTGAQGNQPIGGQGGGIFIQQPGAPAPR